MFHFFLLFFETYLCKSKKNELQKNDTWSNTIFNTILKCEYPLRKPKSYFWKICPYVHTHVLFPSQLNRARFYQKNIDEITILHRNLVSFWGFFRITLYKPILIFQKCMKSDMKYSCDFCFFNFFAKSPYIKQI